MANSKFSPESAVARLHLENIDEDVLAMDAAAIEQYETRIRILRKLLQLLEVSRGKGEATDHIERKLKEYHPATVFLDTKEGIERVALAIAQNHPVVTDYGSTYGTAFPLGIRELVAYVRKEEAPLAIVSLICSKKDALRWMDRDRLHPDLVDAIDTVGLDMIEGISFIRFPATPEAKEELGEYYVNGDNEIQVFIVENDPLMDCLAKKYNIHYIAVRSSNITGKPEEPFINGAENYAKDIGAPIFAVRSKEAFAAQLADQQISSSEDATVQLRRKRVGSQPILSFTQKPNSDHPDKMTAVVELVRAGNTSPETMLALLRDFLDGKIDFHYREEKKAAHTRRMFQVSKDIEDPIEVKKAILEATLL